MSGNSGGSNVPKDKDDPEWPSLSKTPRDTRESSHPAQTPKKVSFQATSQGSPNAAEVATPLQQSSASMPTFETATNLETEKGGQKGKGQGGYGTEGGQRGSNAKSKGKGEDHHGIRKDLEKIEQKVDMLLEKMEKFTKEVGAAILAEKEEKAMKIQAPPPLTAHPGEPQQFPVNQVAPAEQAAPAQQHGGKSHKKNRGGGKAAPPDPGSGSNKSA